MLNCFSSQIGASLKFPYYRTHSFVSLNPRLCSSTTYLCYQCSPTACLCFILICIHDALALSENMSNPTCRESVPFSTPVQLPSLQQVFNSLSFTKGKESKGRSSYPSFFHKVCNHDDDSCVLFPDHPPEIFKCRLQRSLGGNVGFCFVVTLQRRHSTKRDERGITEDQLIIQVPSKWNRPCLE